MRGQRGLTQDWNPALPIVDAREQRLHEIAHRNGALHTAFLQHRKMPEFPFDHDVDGARYGLVGRNRLRLGRVDLVDLRDARVEAGFDDTAGSSWSRPRS